MAQELAFATPRAEEMTEVAIGMGSAGITGLAEGVVLKFAPGMGALEPVFTWGTLIGAPITGAIGALFTRGLLSKVFMGVAAGGAAILGYSLPVLAEEFMPTAFGRKSIKQPASPGTKYLPSPRGTERSYQPEFEAVAPHAF